MEKLIKIQSELKAPKNQYNKYGEYYYRNCEDILEAVKPLLLTHNCTLTMQDDIIEVGGRIYVKATIVFIDNESKTNISVTGAARETLERKKFDESQLTGAASSYARKYALNGLFLIDDTKDADATNKGEEQPKTKPEAKDISKQITACETQEQLHKLYISLNDSERAKYGKQFTDRKLQISKTK